MNKVKIYLNVLSSSMENRICGEISGANIVTPKNWGRWRQLTKFMEKRVKPNVYPSCMFGP